MKRLLCGVGLVAWLLLGAYVGGLTLMEVLAHSRALTDWLDDHNYPFNWGEPWNSLALAWVACVAGGVVGFLALWRWGWRRRGGACCGTKAKD